MKNFHLTFGLILCLLTICCLTGCSSSQRNNPEAIVSGFLDNVESGNTSKAISFFVDEKYASAPNGGYEAYFRTEHGTEPNLYFLKGHPFTASHMVVKSVTKQEFCVNTFECGETSEVEVSLGFNKSVYSPYLLPVRLADSYGDKYSDADVEKMLTSPIEYGRSITKQLRPTITSHSLDHFKAVIPKLKSIKANFFLTRRNSMSPWQIEFFTLTNPVFTVKGEELKF